VRIQVCRLHIVKSMADIGGLADDGLVLLLQRGSLGADGGAVGVDIAELVVDAHCLGPPELKVLDSSDFRG
jgi:hypothetical protein